MAQLQRSAVSGNLNITGSLVVTGSSTFNSTLSGTAAQFVAITCSNFSPPITASPAGATNQIQFNSGSVLTADANFVWDNGNDRLGVGTPTPSVKHHVKSSSEVVRLETTTVRNSGSNYLSFHDPIGIKGYIGYGGTATDDLNISNAIGGSDITLLTSGSDGNLERMRITNSGNVGIGTISPIAKLEVYNAGVGGTRTILSEGADVNFKLFTDSTGVNVNNSIVARLGLAYTPISGNHNATINFHRGLGATDGFISFSTNTTQNERMRITSAGNVGIGTSSPQEKLEVNGAIIMAASNNLTWGGQYGQGTPAIFARSTAAGDTVSYMEFYPNGTSSPMTLRLNASGTVSIRTSTEYGRFNVRSSVGRIVGFNALTSSSPEAGNLWYDTDDTGWQFRIGKYSVISSTFTPQMTFKDDGNIGIGTNNPRNLLELGGLANRQLRIGGEYSGPTSGYTADGQETTRHDILFSSWRDIVPNTVGAKISAINKTALGGSPWYLVQNTDIAFSTLNGAPAGVDNTVERMRITSDGKVGIGTATPGSSKATIVSDGTTDNCLTLSGNVNPVYFLNMQSPSTNGTIGFDSDGFSMTIANNKASSLAYVSLNCNSVDGVVVRSNGINATVGINKATANATLDVNGNAIVSGNLTASGDLAVNGGDITTTAAVLNINAAAGAGTIALQDNTTINGTLSGSGDFTVGGDLAINGGDLTTTATTFNLLNTNATTVNFGWAASSFQLGFNNPGVTTNTLFASGASVYQARNLSSNIVDNAEIGNFNVMGVTSSNPGASSNSTRAGFRGRWDGTNGAGKAVIVVGAANSSALSTIATFNSGGLTVNTGDAIINNGNLVIGTSGGGINFSNTTPDGTGATGISELLDDYEQGSFTPTVQGVTTAGAASYALRTAHYVKVGNLVFIRMSVTWSAHTGTGQILITGLPFSPANDAPLSIYAYDLTYTAGASLSAVALNTTSQLRLYQCVNGGTQAASSLNMDTAASVVIAGCYQVL